MGTFVVALLLVSAFAVASLAADLVFPRLEGRVVDAANIIPAPVRASITDKLETLEAKSGIQFVVATVPSLQGEEIEPFANALFRHWGLGEKEKNNGVLLLVAPKEHRVRIEVGYGLEGTLTDALSKIVITNAITPRFKTGDFGGGIARGVDDVITILTTDSSEWEKRPELRIDRKETATDTWAPWIAFALFLLIVFLLIRTPRPPLVQRGGTYYPGRPRWGTAPTGVPSRGWVGREEPVPPGRRSGWSDLLSFLLGVWIGSMRNRRDGGWGNGPGDFGGFGGGSNGGFSGGGGSSGGGGASGSW